MVLEIIKKDKTLNKLRAEIKDQERTISFISIIATIIITLLFVVVLYN